MITLIFLAIFIVCGLFILIFLNFPVSESLRERTEYAQKLEPINVYPSDEPGEATARANNNFTAYSLPIGPTIPTAENGYQTQLPSSSLNKKNYGE